MDRRVNPLMFLGLSCCVGAEVEDRVESIFLRRVEPNPAIVLVLAVEEI